MQPRFVGRLSLADAVTVTNAMVGFVAVVVAPGDPELAARLVLLAAVADGLDGVVARWAGSSAAGEYLDSLADVASFAVAPAVVVVAVVGEAWEVSVADPTARTVLAVGLPALFVAMAVTRLGMYTAFDTAAKHTEGAPSTLAATILASAVLAGVAQPQVLLAGTAVFVYLMVSTVRYPDLLARDALLMGVVHSLAVLFPEFAGMAFPYALLTLGLAYLTLSPRFYWREGDPAANGNA
ncbi:protein sorting system archaetidylserine synthase [Halostella litorea]|uniref:protein sorting system archaetidylserine synthase n=1 Tax=Halostella litorea TaxID=2528831 RepID=UPI0010923203|nr:protein sorting system archaetidylserine synthase [Halostella litorea]